MSNVYPKFQVFFVGLPKAQAAAVHDLTPRRRFEWKHKRTKKAWRATMRPYVAAVMWLVLQHTINGPEAAREAYLKLGADRRALVQIGYAVVFGGAYAFEPGFAYIRDDMFVGVDLKEGEFPVRTLTNMRLGTYRRLVEMGGVAA